MDISVDNITAVILAGGRSHRMQGNNKGLVKLAGQPMIQHVLQQLQPQISNIVISANLNLDQYAQFNCPIIADEMPGFAGPLAGIYSVMTRMATDWLLTVPCDTPNIPTDYVVRMQRAGYDHRLCVAHDGVRQQPAFCLIHKSLKNDVQSAIHNKQLAVHRFLASHNVMEVDFSDANECFVNINTPEQLKQYENKHEDQ
jgi:molybdenum cofactor guanylyltransferase